jgi:hypothetical protein
MTVLSDGISRKTRNRVQVIVYKLINRPNEKLGVFRYIIQDVL